MKKKFLDGLKGLPLKSAKIKVLKANLDPVELNVGDNIASVAFPNTVLLWLKDGKVQEATAGDPAEMQV